jgi:hypothetical protein
MERQCGTRAASSRCLICAALNWLMLVPITLGVSGCAASQPQIGRNLPSAFHDANVAFDERVKERFPIGSSESALLAELKHEGFKVSESTTEAAAFNFFALYDAPGFPCRLFWKVLWTSADAKITAIAGRYSGVCL